MDTTTYTSPVDKLLTIGKPDPTHVEDWPDYLELGLTTEHIPELLWMLTDKELLEIDPEKPEGWAPVHAMRALGQLREAAVVEPLLSNSEALLDYDTGLGEWAIEELPEVYGLIGPAAIPLLTQYLADESQDLYVRANAATSLQKIATMHPEAKSECIAALTRQLEVGTEGEDDPELNAFIITDGLIPMKAVETLPIVERAFEAHAVDESIVNLEDVQVGFGLKEREEEPPLSLKDLFGSLPSPSTPKYKPSDFTIVSPTGKPTTVPSKASKEHGAGTAATKKAKIKMEKRSRKKNRKKN
jgi:hypothetical protein